MKKLLMFFLFLNLQSQAQLSLCDSVQYNISAILGGDLLLNGSISNSLQDSLLSFDWAVCDAIACYAASGPSAFFGQFSTNDTLKACLSANISYLGIAYTCYSCDSLSYDGNNGWGILNTGTSSNTIIQMKPDFQIYPNPTKGNLTIDLGSTYQDIKLTFYNSIGQVISSIQYPHSHFIHFNIEYSKGIYFLQIEAMETIYTIKIVKM